MYKYYMYAKCYQPELSKCPLGLIFQVDLGDPSHRVFFNLSTNDILNQVIL